MDNQMLVALQMNRAFQLMAESLNLPDEKALEIADLYEPWAAGKTYPQGKILKYGVNDDGETTLYVVLQAHTSQEDWPPDNAPSLFKRVGLDPAGTAIWTQPLGAVDAYQIGDEVSHGGHVWKSTVNDNVWEPGVYGWEQIS